MVCNSFASYRKKCGHSALAAALISAAFCYQARTKTQGKIGQKRMKKAGTPPGMLEGLLKPLGGFNSPFCCMN